VPEINFNRTPVTLIIAAVAVAIELVCVVDPTRRLEYYNKWMGIWIQMWRGEVWRPFTTTLLHGGLLHLLMNMSVWFAFAPALENRFGSYRFLGMVLLLAYTSTLAQYCVGNYTADIQAQAMVGLSGVLFGLVGFMYVGYRKDSALAMVFGPQTIQFVSIWFVLCIIGTLAGWLRIGNTAHAAGFIYGYLYGQAVYAKEDIRPLWVLAATVGTLTILGAIIACPGHAGYESVTPWWR
jgi:membrane associated rhomboid family serine protease